MTKKTNLNKNDYLFKILVVGDKNVGKTTLLHRFISGKFLFESIKTIGVEISVKEIMIDGINYTLQFWDFGGEKYYRFFQNQFSQNADGCIIIFDLTNEQSTRNLKDWAEMCKFQNKNTPLILLGSKADLRDQIVISHYVAENLKEILECIDYFEISSLNGLNIEEAFYILADHIITTKFNRDGSIKNKEINKNNE